MREYDDNQPQPETVGVTPKTPNYMLSFNNKEGQQVGGFDFNGEEMVFTGQAEESAKVFVDWIATVFKDRLKQEYEKGRADALAAHGILGGK